MKERCKGCPMVYCNKVSGKVKESAHLGVGGGGQLDEIQCSTSSQKTFTEIVKCTVALTVVTYSSKLTYFICIYTLLESINILYKYA